MAKKAKKPAVTIPVPPAKVPWVDTTTPTLAQVIAAPIGRAYAFKEYPGCYHVRVKVGPDTWLQVCDRTVAKAVEEWRTAATDGVRGTGWFTIDKQIQKVCAEYTQLKRFS